MEIGPPPDPATGASVPDETGAPITIVSTHTIDVVPDRNGRGSRELPGGPAHYIADALTRLGCPFKVITGDTVRVTVLPGQDGEEYIIPPIPLITLPPRLEGRAVILSPVMREIDPHRVPPVRGLLVVDLQGFVREPDVPTAHVQRKFDLEALLRRADVVKATDSEIGSLTSGCRKTLSDRILVVTRGKKGAIVRDRDEEFPLRVEPLPVENTIGAGDIFLAGFVFSLISGHTPYESGLQALQVTSGLLRERLRENAANQS